MANELDDEIYPNNDDLLVCRPVRLQINTGTGAEETVPLTGRVDVVAFLSTSGDPLTATAIGVLSIALTEASATAVYHGVMEGVDKATELLATADGTVLYRHFKAGQDYHEVKSVVYRKARLAA